MSYFVLNEEIVPINYEVDPYNYVAVFILEMIGDFEAPQEKIDQVEQALRECFLERESPAEEIIEQ